MICRLGPAIPTSTSSSPPPTTCKFNSELKLNVNRIKLKVCLRLTDAFEEKKSKPQNILLFPKYSNQFAHFTNFSKFLE